MLVDDVYDRIRVSISIESESHDSESGCLTCRLVNQALPNTMGRLSTEKALEIPQSPPMGQYPSCAHRLPTIITVTLVLMDP